VLNTVSVTVVTTCGASPQYKEGGRVRSPAVTSVTRARTTRSCSEPTSANRCRRRSIGSCCYTRSDVSGGTDIGAGKESVDSTESAGLGDGGRSWQPLEAKTTTTGPKHVSKTCEQRSIELRVRGSHRRRLMPTGKPVFSYLARGMERCKRLASRICARAHAGACGAGACDPLRR
jgi:hypothetical protein